MGVRGRSIAALACTLAALAAVQAAGANTSHPVAADQASAGRAVLKLADLPPVVRWKASGSAAGPAVAGSSSSFSCRDYNPKTSDLVTTGEATADFTAPGIALESDVTLLSTARMVQLDWQRSFVPALGPCLAQSFAKNLAGSIRNVAVKRLSFPRLADHATAYRLVYDYAGGKRIRGVTDLVLVSGGRAEISLLLVSAFRTPSELKAGEAAMSLMERDLAATVAGRLLAPKKFTA